MSFLVLNKTAGALVINDLGLTIPAATGGSPEPGIFDLSFEDPKQVAKSDDLVTQIQGGNLVVLDPLNSVTELSAAASEEIILVHNDPHYRIRGGTLNQLDDVNLDAAGSPQVLTNTVLQWNNSDAFEPISPDDLIGDGSGAVQDIIASTLVNGNDTTITFDGSPFTTIQVDVDDVFLRNTGDTLDSGTLTIAEGATLLVSGDGGSGGATLTIGQDATATIVTPTGGFSNDNDIVNKEYVDSVAAGLDPKESVRVATESGDTAGTYVAASPCGPGDTITGFPGIIDTITLVADDRVLVKDRTDPKENGIYVVTTVNATSPLTVDLTRAEDQDGTPSNEVSSGNFTHVEQGVTNINTKWIVTGDGLLTLCVDDINWTLFSGPDTIVADIGLVRTGNTIALDLSTTELTTATPALADRIAFHDDDGSGQAPTGTQTYGATFTSTYNAHDVVYGISSDGIVVRTADDTYTSRTIVASTVEDRVGLEVLDGDGVAGNPTIGLDIENLPYITAGSPQGAITTTDRVPVYDVDLDRNVYYNVSDIAGALASTNSFETWSGGGNTSGDPSIVADSSTDVATLAGGTGIDVAITAATDTITLNLDFTAIPSSGSPLGIDVTDEIIINNGGTIETTTLGDLITQLGLDTDEQVKVSSNDTTPGYLNGKLVAGTYTTLTENNDGGNETLTVDTDPSTIQLSDLGDVSYGSPLPQAGDILQYGGSPQGWTVVPASTLTFDVCTLSDGSTATLDLTDEIAVCDSGSTVKFSFGDAFDTLGVPTGITSTGIVVRTSGSPTTWASRSVVESTNAGEEGAQVNNGDGVAGDIEVGVDINNLTNSADDLDTTDELIVYDGANNVSMSGQQVADGVSTILGFGDLSVQPIGGSGSPSQMTLFLTDSVRGKDLSTNEFSLTWSEGNVGNNDWLEIGNANDADIGFIVPMNATIVRATAFSVSAGSNKDIDLYVDAALDSTLLTIPSGSNTSVEDITLNVDVDAGERLRLRGGSAGGSIQDTTVVVWLKWRT